MSTASSERVERRFLPIAFAQFFQALEDAAVNQNPRALGLDQILRAGDGAHSAKRMKGCSREVSGRKGFKLNNRAVSLVERNVYSMENFKDCALFGGRNVLE